MAGGCATEAFSTTFAIHIENCGGRWLSGCHSSVAEHLEFEPFDSQQMLFSFHFHPITSISNVRQEVLSEVFSTFHTHAIGQELFARF